MGGQLSVSTEYSTIGGTSIKSTKTSSRASLDVNYFIPNEKLGKKITFIFDAYSPDNTYVYLFCRDVNSIANMITSIELPKKTNTQIILSTTIPDDSVSVFIRLSNSFSSVYITNITINIQ